MGVEIERKFLVNHDKWVSMVKPAGIFYKQGYFINDGGLTGRIRVAGANAYITFKGPTSGISRNEYEYAIPAADGMELLRQFALSAIEKKRYRINFANKLWEVDEFTADNEGLIIAEIELNSEDEQFKLPDWVGAEVTGQEKYYNSCLSVHPFKQW